MSFCGLATWRPATSVAIAEPFLPRMSSNVSAPTFGAMIKSSGQLGDVEQVREPWKEMNTRGLQPGLVPFGCMAVALVMTGEPDEALELIRNHADSERRGSASTP